VRLENKDAKNVKKSFPDMSEMGFLYLLFAHGEASRDAGKKKRGARVSAVQNEKWPGLPKENISSVSWSSA
jgi:hypothetical protein